MSRLLEAGRLLRTVQHLAPSQVAHRVRLRALRGLYGLHVPTTERVFSAPGPAESRWPTFEPLDLRLTARGHPSAEANATGTFEFLNERHDLGVPIDWDPPAVSQLWRYHLHYFDWAWDLAIHPDVGWARDTYRRLYESWRDANPVGKWDAWSPYVVSLRAWTMCAMHAGLVAPEPWERMHVADLARHARYLRANVEFDVGGNHLVKNLKALVGLGIFLRDDGLLRFALQRLRREVVTQVLPDGGHFERSPSYHAQVLGDLVDVVQLGRAAGLRSSILGPLETAASKMRHWLAVMRMPDGTIPLLNDCLPLERGTVDALGVAPHRPPNAAVLLPQSGYAILASHASPWHTVVDVGPPCPPELPAHAHADALSVTCQLRGDPVLVDTGTSTYAGDLARRQYERSTAAHNTVVVGGGDSTEVHGAFRAGRRHRITVEDLTDVGVTAFHDGYRHLSGAPVHRRRVRFEGRDLVIEDTVEGARGHSCAAYFHIAPGIHPRLLEANTIEAGPARVTFDGGQLVGIDVVEPGSAPWGLVGRGHGVLVPSACVIVAFEGEDDARLHTRFTPA